MPKEPKAHVSIRIEKDLYQEAKKRAESENRTFANWLETLVKKELKKLS